MFGVISYEYVIFGAIDLHQEQQVLPHTQDQVLLVCFVWQVRVISYALWYIYIYIYLLVLPD